MLHLYVIETQRMSGVTQIRDYLLNASSSRAYAHVTRLRRVTKNAAAVSWACMPRIAWLEHASCAQGSLYTS